MRLPCLVAAAALLCPSAASAADLPWLVASGDQITTETGEVVPLRGVCLGSWLFIETWIGLMDYPAHGRLLEAGSRMGAAAASEQTVLELGPTEAFEGGTAAYIDAFELRMVDLVGAPLAAAVADEARDMPSTIDDSELPLRQLLSSRFGDPGRDEIIDAFHQAWITEADFDEMAAMGMSLIRLPMTYREILVVDGDDVPVSPVRLREPVLARVDQAIEWAGARGMYVALDIQEAPGGQNNYSGSSTLYQDPRMQEMTLDMWALLSDRYHDEPTVAMYSLLAEPMSAPTEAQMVDLYDRIYDVIRARGDRHLMVIHDGFKGLSALPDPATIGWSGVVYSTHLFEWGMPPFALAYKGLIAFYAQLFGAVQDRYDVPIYIGSFSTMDDERYAYRGLESWLQTFNDQGWPWTMWTWKRLDDPMDAELYGVSTAWGVHQTPTQAWRRADPWRDDKATLIQKMSTYSSQTSTVNRTLKDLLEGYLTE